MCGGPSTHLEKIFFLKSIVEPDDLEAGMIALHMGVVVREAQLPLHNDGTGPPDRFDRLVVDGLSEFNEQDEGEFAIVEAVIQRLEAIKLLPHGLRHGAGSPAMHHLDIGWEQSRIPCCRKRRWRVRTVSGWVSVSCARWAAVRSANNTRGRITS